MKNLLLAVHGHFENFNFSVSDYAISNSGGTIAGGDGETPNRYIPSGQAFFISYSNAATPDVVNGNINRIIQLI